ncbi:MAG TPA: hypothetical protein DCP90_03655 [Clostridiales bacterium]|nr:MAG: hypothetical protein A2Y22_02980 [Clostridiales bacterium GWD2_32_59]HAN09690.1 hypothetical protein [Clostridiales bacterium]
MKQNNLDGYDRFINDLTSYYSQFENTRGEITLFKEAYKKAIEQELPERENQRNFQIRDFTNSTGLNINLSFENLYCKQDEEKKLVVGTVSPNWDNGWRNISENGFVSEQISDFFYFAKQYIHRSYEINLIVAIAIVYGRACDFRGRELRQMQLPFSNEEYLEFTRSSLKDETTRTVRLVHYLKIINSLDPWVNKANYYYVRAIDLRNRNFFEEAITCLDNTVDIIIQYLKFKKKIPTLHRNIMIKDLQKEMGVNNKVCEDLERLYLLRCKFSAHPAQSKWWDFSEIYEDDIDNIFRSVQNVLVKFFQYENRNRNIEPNPENWTEWFCQNADVLFDAVWFHRIP